MRAGVSIAFLVAAAAGCDSSVDTASSSDGGDHPEAKTWCSNIYGVVRSPDAAPSAYGQMCKEGEICATEDDVRFDCCKVDQDGCGQRPGPGFPDPGYYCNIGLGWVQNPLLEGAGVACASGQTCAQHNDKRCGYICCDIATNSDCGVPYSQDCQRE